MASTTPKSPLRPSEISQCAVQAVDKHSPSLAPPLRPVAVRLSDACRALGIGNTSLYDMMGKGEIKSIRIAGRRLIPVSEIDRIVAEACAQVAA